MYIIVLYTLNYYEDKYFISLFAHLVNILSPNVYPDYYNNNLSIFKLKKL